MIFTSEHSLTAFTPSQFTFKNVIKERNINTFVPSWFVTYNGIMVSCVVGAGYGYNDILKFIVYYGILIYIIIIPIMIYRLLTVEVKDQVYHTMAVVLAPCSLCVVSYINVIAEPNRILLYFLYLCVLASLAFIIVKLPKFFRYSFTPGFAGFTFPMAIGVVATGKMAVKILKGEADVATMPIEYAPNFTKKFNKEICDELGITIPDGYEEIVAE